MLTPVRVVVAIVVGMAGSAAWGTSFEWRFNGDLLPAVQSGGTAVMTYLDADSQTYSSFGTTGGPIPNPAGGPANYIYLAGNSIPTGGKGGYAVDYTGVPGNGGGADVNDYTMIWDVYIPTLAWTSLFNTSPSQGNDGDLFVDPTGRLGIGALGYSAAGAVTAAQWHRLALAYDLTNNQVKYYVDGTPVFTGAASTVDGRFAVYADYNPGTDFNVLGDNDNEINDVYLSAFLFTNTVLSDNEIGRLGGVNAAGITPEPASLALLAMGGVAWLRRRRA